MKRTTLQICGALLGCALIPTAFADDTKAGGGGGDSLRDLVYASLAVNRTDIGLDKVGSLVNIGFASGVRIPTIDWIGVELAGSATVIPGKNSNESGGLIGKADCIGGVPNVPPGCTIPGGGGGGGGSGGDPSPTTQDDAQVFDLGIYAVVRTPGRFYATGRVGWRYFQTNLDTRDGDLYDQRSGVAFGGGLGWRWGQTLSGIEIGYTRISSDVNQIYGGIVYGFGGHY